MDFSKQVMSTDHERQRMIVRHHKRAALAYTVTGTCVASLCKSQNKWHGTASTNTRPNDSSASTCSAAESSSAKGSCWRCCRLQGLAAGVLCTQRPHLKSALCAAITRRQHPMQLNLRKNACALFCAPRCDMWLRSHICLGCRDKYLHQIKVRFY